MAAAFAMPLQSTYRYIVQVFPHDAHGLIATDPRLQSVGEGTEEGQLVGDQGHLLAPDRDLDVPHVGEIDERQIGTARTKQGLLEQGREFVTVGGGLGEVVRVLNWVAVRFET